MLLALLLKQGLPHSTPWSISLSPLWAISRVALLLLEDQQAADMAGPHVAVVQFLTVTLLDRLKILPGFTMVQGLIIRITSLSGDSEIPCVVKPGSELFWSGS